MTEPADLIGLSEIADLLDVRPSAVTNWRHRNLNFPEPWGEWRCGPLYLRAEVEQWWADRLALRLARNDRAKARLQAQLKATEREREKIVGSS